MKDAFLSHGSTFWTGIQAITNCVYTVVVIVTLWLIYLQVRTATKAFQLDAIRALQELVDSFREDRRSLFSKCPLALSFSQRQFASTAPGRHRWGRFSGASTRIRRLTKLQSEARMALDESTREGARKIIARLNDIRQLVEDGFIDRQVLLGKYHVLIIQCCHMVECFRRAEETRRGGNYGHRLLRMRLWAIHYNDAWSKHRGRSIEITSGDTGLNRRAIHRSPAPTLFRMTVWFFRRLLDWY